MKANVLAMVLSLGAGVLGCGSDSGSGGGGTDGASQDTSGADTAAGGGSGCSATTPLQVLQFSCQAPNGSTCSELRGEGWASESNAKKLCDIAGGTLSKDACPADKMIGFCIKCGTDSQQVTYEYAGDAALKKSVCESMKAAWVPK